MAKIGYPVPQEGRASDWTGTALRQLDAGDVNYLLEVVNRPGAGASRSS